MRQPPPQSRSSLFVSEAAARALRAGVASHQAGDLPRAAALYRQCLAVCPNHVDALVNLGSILRVQGQTAEALAMLQRACTLDPRDTGAHFNLANAFDATGQTASAIDTYRTLLDFQPDHAMAWYNLGLVLQTQGSLDEAAAAYRHAMAFNPGHREARLNLASTLSTCGQLSAARTELENLLAQVPDCGPALNNLASLAQDLCEHVRALSLLQHVSALAPELTQPRSNFLLGLQYHPAATPAELLNHARAWGEWATARTVGRDLSRLLRQAQDRHVGLKPDLHKREDLWLKPDLQKREALRVGYVSADLCMHPVGLFLKEVIAAHDPARVLPVLYSNGAVGDGLTRELQASVAALHGGAGGWREVRELDDNALFERIRADHIDILVDLSGHTAKSRLAMFACRPAPLQISWLGYFATTGLPAMDFVILDPYHAPPGTEAQFTERVLRLPHNRFCYTPVSFAPAVAPAPVFKNRFVTFGSFNNTAKLNEAVLDVWAQILKAVPNSRLILKWRTFADGPYSERIRSFFIARGIAAERIELRPASHHRRLLEEYADIDIALDPFPFSGGHTSCEALWMGVPVVTWPQERVVSRQTYSFLANIGLGELAASSAEEYRHIACALSNDPARLKQLRQTMRERMAASPLCDVAGFTRLLEDAYRDAWRQIATETALLAGQVSPAHAVGSGHAFALPAK